MRVYKNHILNTPPDPRLCLFISLLLAISVQVSAQNMSDSEVREAIQTKYDSLAIGEIYQQERMKKWRFLNFLPSPGYSVLQGPTLTYNLGQVTRFFEARERYRVEAEKTTNKYQEKAEEDYKDYLELKYQIQEKEAEVSYQSKVLDLERKLFAISERKYENHEITPSEFLTDEIAFRRKELSYEKLKNQVERLERRMTELYSNQKYYADRY